MSFRPAWCALGVAVLAVAVSAAAGAPPAAAGTSPGWSIQPTPSPASPASSNSLWAVSCPSLSACAAVGSSFVGPAPTTFAERWNGRAWLVEPTASPPGGELWGVSCSAATSCIAVGNYIAATTSGSPSAFPLVERWNGLAWVVQRTPLRTLASGGNLAAVSCASAAACTAVGSASSAGDLVPLIERWNGVAWVIQSAPAPAGADYAVLEGVSCTSGTSCTAVGTYEVVAGAYMTFADRWDGRSWTLQQTPSLGGTNHLTGVSCTSATACTAVGDSDSLSGDVPLVERWDGTSWTVQTAPSPVVRAYAALHGVSCASASSCTAVGDFNDFTTTGPTAFAEHWDGTTWTLQSVPTPAQAVGAQLFGVSCPSASVCTAAGLSYNSFVSDDPLAERYS